MKWEEICKYQSAINKHNAAADRWDAAATATQNLMDDTDDADVIPWMEAIESTKMAQATIQDGRDIAASLAWIQHTLDEDMVIEPEGAIDQAEEMATLHRAWVDKLHDIMCGR